MDPFYDSLQYVGLFALILTRKFFTLLFKVTLVTLVCINMYVGGTLLTCVIK